MPEDLTLESAKQERDEILAALERVPLMQQRVAYLNGWLAHAGTPTDE
jgi:hypothetical protein